MKIFTTIVSAMALTTTLGIADVAEAKDNKGNKGNKNKAEKVLDNKPGKSGKSIPPGQVKRYTRGAKLPSDLSFDEIDDLSKWKLKAPGKGNKYIRVDNEILEVSEDLSTVVDAVGVVGDLLK